MDSSELKRRSHRELADLATRQGVEGGAAMRRAELVVALLQVAARRGDELTGDGVLEVMPDGFGFLRSPHLAYLPGADDVYVSPSQIRRFELRTGDLVAGVVRPPKDGERFVALLKVSAVNQRSPDSRRAAQDFTELEVVPSSRALALAGAADAPLLLRAVDLLAPLARGSRALVVGPAGAGKRALLAAMAAALARVPDLSVHVLVVDQPREDLAELAAGLAGVELVATALDEPPARHAQVAELVQARAERLAEAGRDVVVVVDSLTRLCRALHGNLASRPTDAVAPAVLAQVRRLLAGGRALAAGGSLTVIASADEAERGADRALLDELIPAAQAIVRLDPGLADAGLTLDAHGTRAGRAERYLPAELASGHAQLGRVLTALSADAAARHLVGLLTTSPTNAAILAGAP